MSIRAERLQCPKTKDKACALIEKEGAEKLIAGYLKGDSAGFKGWKALDLVVMALLICAPIPGTLVLAEIYRRTMISHGLSSDDVLGWVNCGMPTLRLAEDEADGFLDLEPILYHTAPDLQNQAIPVKEDAEGWKEKTRQYLEFDNILEQSLGKPSPNLSTPVAQATYDAFREIGEMDIHAFHMGEALNQVTKLPTDKIFTAQYTGDFTQVPNNARGNPKKMATVSRLGTSNGLHYSSEDRTQVLNTAATRYAVQQKAFVMDHEGHSLARKIADNLYDSVIDEQKLPLAWNDISQSSVYNGWLRKARSAGYAASHTLLMEEDDRILRFQGKGNFKAKEDPVSLDGSFKAPQGILAWSKGANSFFGYACRTVADVVKNSLKDEVTWNNGMTVEQAATRFVKATSKVPTPQNVRLDAVEMDSKQNEFTHMINKYFIQRLMVSCEFLDLYFSMLEEYTAVSPEMRMKLRWVKPSGEPWTLFGNSFLMAAICLWVIIGDGPMALFTQGDDVDRNQANMRIDNDRLENLSLYCAFEMSMEWGDFAAFCGYVLQNGQLVPNIRRKLIKLSGCNFRSQRHFEEVQIGMRDWVKTLKSSLAFSDILKVNAETYSTTYENVEGWFEAIDSLSHINAEQFAAASTRVQLNTKYLAQGAKGVFDRIESIY